MKLAIIGSRTLWISNFQEYIPDNVTEIVSGGAKGIDSQAAAFAKEHHIPMTEFLPDYAIYGKAAPLKRNEKIAAYADMALAFWDGASKGTKHTISLFEKQGKPVTVIKI